MAKKTKTVKNSACRKKGCCLVKVNKVVEWPYYEAA